MKLMLTLIKILVFILLLFVLTQNSSQYVQIKLLDFTYSEVSLVVVILVALLIGAVVGGIFFAFYVIQVQGESRHLRKKNGQLMNELESLRNISVDEIPEDDEIAMIPEVIPPKPVPVDSNNKKN